MANTTKTFVSLVAIGRQNPQILNVDWLINNNIMSKDEPFFVELCKAGKKFTKFLSTPPFTNLVLGPIDFIIDEQRFQIRDNSGTNWKNTITFDIAQKYFNVLHHTPLKMVGINLNYKINFENPKEANIFQQLFLSNNSKVIGIIGKSNIEASVVLFYPSSEFGVRVMLAIDRFNEVENSRAINFNYEFNFTDWSNFKINLEKLPTIADYSDSIINKLLKAI